MPLWQQIGLVFWAASQAFAATYCAVEYRRKGDSAQVGLLVGWGLAFIIPGIGWLVAVGVAAAHDDLRSETRGDEEARHNATMHPFAPDPPLEEVTHETGEDLVETMVCLSCGVVIRLPRSEITDDTRWSQCCPRCRGKSTRRKASSRKKTLPQSTSPKAISGPSLSRPYVILDVPQNTREWHALRAQGIGGSDAVNVMRGPGSKSWERVMEEKLLSVTRPANASMQLGSLLESEARDRYERHRRISVEPAVLRSSRRKWMLASLDGLSEDGATAVEIKCGEGIYNHVCDRGCVPTQYRAQLQHYLAVTGLSSIDFWCYWPHRKPKIIVVERDDAYIEELLNREQAFWRALQRRRARLKS